ncbi:MAG TPA: hypothetical protein VEB60_01440 [Candidatus Paceibacterota bacterium]|nr:hypothetical protein [Candidatus Paceibacterota bacterium]
MAVLFCVIVGLALYSEPPQAVPLPKPSHRLPGDMQEWLKDFQQGFLDQIALLPEEEVRSANEEAFTYEALKEKLEEECLTATTVTLSAARAHMAMFATRDLEPFLATATGMLPNRDRVMKRMRTKRAPQVRSKFMTNTLARITTDTLQLNLSVLGMDYEHWRKVMCHEMVHYLIQGSLEVTTLKYLMEGTTDYITMCSLESLYGKKLPVHYHEACDVALLVPAAGRFLLEGWYTSETPPSDTETCNRISRLLENMGLPTVEAGLISSAWTDGYITQFEKRKLWNEFPQREISELRSRIFDFKLAHLDFERSCNDFGIRINAYCDSRGGTVFYKPPGYDPKWPKWYQEMLPAIEAAATDKELLAPSKAQKCLIARAAESENRLQGLEEACCSEFEYIETELEKEREELAAAEKAILTQQDKWRQKEKEFHRQAQGRKPVHSLLLATLKKTGKLDRSQLPKFATEELSLHSEP